MTSLMYDTLPDDATFQPLDRPVFYPPDFPALNEWAAHFRWAYDLKHPLSAFFDSPCYVARRGVRLSSGPAWDRLWSRLFREVGDE